MTRAHYSSRRPKKARSTPLGALDVNARLKPAPELVPAASGLVECPVCHGHVKTVGAPYSDEDAGISYQLTRVVGVHATGGVITKGLGRCAGSHQLPA